MLTVAAFVGVFREGHIEDDGESGAHEQDLQHEVVEGLLQDCAEGLADEGRTHVVTKVSSALRQVSRGEALVQVDLKKSSERLAA